MTYDIFRKLDGYSYNHTLSPSLNYRESNLVSKLLVDSELVVENVQRMLLLPFTDEKERDITTFPFHLAEIDKCRIHSAQTSNQTMS